MNYELAKQLKDAGFPQGIISADTMRAFKHFKQEPCYYPTLEELIEACGKGFENLDRIDYTDGIVQWQANLTVFASTPTEAVALLYISLVNVFDVINIYG